MGSASARWIIRVSVLLVISGLLLTATSERIGNLVILVGGIGQVWGAVEIWTNPGPSGLSHPRVWAGIFLALGVSFIVPSAIFLA
jgi:hypothetical protein